VLSGAPSEGVRRSGQSERASRAELLNRVVALAAVACVLLAGCLGSDYRSQPLSLSQWDHGWQATIEPDENFDVTLRPDRLAPEARWRLVDVDPGVVELVDQGVEAPAAEEPDRSPLWWFGFRGVDRGRTSLEFEAVLDGERVNAATYTVAVVDDACAAGQGVTAARCRDPMPDHGERGWTEWDHGGAVQVGLGDEAASVTLTAHPLHQDAEWRVASADASQLALGPPTVSDVRAAGDFDNRDRSRPESFLPVWQFPVDGLQLGTSTLVFEIVVDGERVDVAEFSVAVRESVDEGEYLVR
jgi:hypothetical protein